MTVPNIFSLASGTIPLEQLDTNFATPVTIGTTPVQLGETVASFSGVSLVSPIISAPTITDPVLGTPASGTLTNCTGLPILTGVSGLASGASAFLSNPSSSNLAALITDETGTGANVFGTSPTLTTPTVTALNGGQLAGLRNKIINGNMDIAQRGTAAVTTSAAYGPADRFRSGTVGSTFSTTIAELVSGDTLYDTGGARYYTSIAVTSVAGAGNYTVFQQHIENVRLLAGQTATLSFWAKAASGAPLIGVELAQNFASGGSPSAAVTGVGQSITLSTTWTKYTKTITLGSLSGKTIGTDVNSSFTQLNFWLDAGADWNTRTGTIGQASKTVSIAQAQLEIGSVATPFEQRAIALELALCQRYYERSSAIVNQVAASSQHLANAWFKVTKRVNPTSIVYTSPVGGATGKGYNYSTLLDIAATTQGAGIDMITVALQTTVSAGNNIAFNYTAEAEL